MNSETYKKVLEDHLIPFMQIHGMTHFFQDGAPCLMSKCINKFLVDKAFEVIHWLNNSPDLNPIHD
jgi:hypothetical protein